MCVCVFVRAWINYNVFVVGKNYLKDFVECACAFSVTICPSVDRDPIRVHVPIAFAATYLFALLSVDWLTVFRETLLECRQPRQIPLKIHW